MALTKYTIGQLIEPTVETNLDNRFGPEDVRGMTITKQIIPTKADVQSADLKKYLVIHPFEFIYNPRTHGRHIGFGYNDTETSFIISWNNIGFRVKQTMKHVVLPEYLFLHFNRDEWDREACYRSWGSSTEVFAFDALCEMELELPPVPVQQKYVDIYKAMIANQQSYERGLEDLKLAIDGMLDQIKTEAPQIPLGELLAEIDNRNSDKAQSLVYGVTMSKQFIPSVANLDGVDISKYKLVATDQIACNFMHVGRDKSLPLAINQTDDPIVVSPAYFVFEKASELCLPEYIVMWLSREESGRYCWFISDSSVRGGFSLEQFYSITIPVTSIDQQYALTSIYNSYIIRKEINDKLKMQIKSICPILIKGSLEEGATQ